MDQKPGEWGLLDQTRLQDMGLESTSGREDGMVEEFMESRRALKG